jgi:two-component system nitrate/nitrite sensor histidine kinase NarX
MIQLHQYSLELKHNHETLTRIQTAVESTGDAISIADPDGVAIYQNRAFSNLYGFTLEELNVRGIPDTLFADPAVAADVFNSVKRGEAWSGEVELRRKAGQVMPALLRADNITDESDVSIGIVAVYTDINRIRQVEASERQQRILAEALQKTISTITGTLELDEVLDLILEYTRQVVPHDAVNIMLIEGNNATVVRSQGYKPQDRQNPLEGWQVSITESAYLRNMLETGETIIIADVDLVSQNDVIQQSQLHAYLGAPILFRSRTIGFINVNSEKPNFFTQYHAERLAIFSQFVGTAIENAQLFAQAQQLAVIKERHRMAQNLHDAVSQTLFSASGIAEALPRIWRKNPEAVLPRLQQLERMTRGALAEMRTLLYELRPAAIHEVDLKHLLTQLAEGAMGRSTVDVRIISDWQPATEIPDVVQRHSIDDSR